MGFDHLGFAESIFYFSKSTTGGPNFAEQGGNKKKKHIRKQSEIKVLGLCAWIGSTPSVQNQEIYD
jgi:hypothetical protein